jgi:hypothetical protein
VMASGVTDQKPRPLLHLGLAGAQCRPPMLGGSLEENVLAGLGHNAPLAPVIVEKRGLSRRSPTRLPALEARR